MITIYLKTHNDTGLKYLGKTEQDPYIYKGSGVYWKSHIKKHGNNVKTEVLFQSDDINEIKTKGLELSQKYNVVESKEFANLMEENGIGGVTSTSFAKGTTPVNKGKKASARARQNMKLAARKRWDKWKEDHPDYEYKKYTPKGKENWDVADNISGINKQKIKCPKCGKTGNVGNMKRWHFDNCTNEFSSNTEV